MMDEREDRFDEMLRDAAQSYNAPPPTPKAEMWERIEAARRAGGPANGIRPIDRSDRPTARPTLRLLMAIAAILVLGVAIGRFTAPRRPAQLAEPGTVAAAPGAEKKERSNIATELATADHLSHVETFFTEFGSERASPEFTDHAKSLLSTTRLLLDSRKVSDPRTRKLLEDLELVLVQIATMNPKDRVEDLNSIADGLAQNQLRTRLRNAIPAGPAIRL